MKPTNKLILFTLSVRALFFLAALFSHISFVDYDTSTALNYGPPTNSSSCYRDDCSWPRFLVMTWDRWDSVHFVDIAIFGYRYEQNFAFYPLLPFTMKALSLIVAPFLNLCIQLFGGIQESPCISLVCDERTAVVLSGIIISHVCSTLSVLEFFVLSRSILPTSDLAEKASLLYAMQPTLPFTMAPYTEPIFAYFSFKGHNCLARKAPRPFLAAAFFALAAATRSNGALYTMFLIHHAALHSPLRKPARPLAPAIAAAEWLWWAAGLAARLILVAAPCALFERFAAALFCLRPPSPHPARDALAWFASLGPPPPPPPPPPPNPPLPKWCGAGTGGLYAHVQVGPPPPSSRRRARESCPVPPAVPRRRRPFLAASKTPRIGPGPPGRERGFVALGERAAGLGWVEDGRA